MEGTEGLRNKHCSQQEPESLEPTLAIRDSTAFPNLGIHTCWMVFRYGLHVPGPNRFHQISTITQPSICTFHIQKLKLREFNNVPTIKIQNS